MNYPHTPGHRGRDTDTSERAAMAVAGDAKQLRERVEAAYRWARTGMTHDECAEILWHNQPLNTAAFERFKRSVRSRASELKAAGRLVAMPGRRTNATGHKAAVWQHTDHTTARAEHRVQEELL